MSTGNPPRKPGGGGAIHPKDAGVSPGKPDPKTATQQPPKPGSKVGGYSLEQAKAVKLATEAEPELNLDALGLDKASVPRLYKEYMERLAPRLRLASTSFSILKAFQNADVTAERVADCIRTNQYFETQFLKMVEAVSKRQEKPSLDAAIILLGMQNSRNLIVALQLERLIRGVHPEWGKDGKPKIVPAEILKYALKAEEIAMAGTKGGYGDTAFNAGLIFDLLAMVGAEVADDKKKIDTYLDQTFAHGLRTAQIAQHMAKSQPDFVSSKWLFSACLAHDVGKVALAILDDGFIDFAEELKNRDLPRTLRHFAEAQKFEVDHAWIGGLCCQSFRMLKPVAVAIEYHHEPFMLRDSNRNQFALAGTIALASNIANHMKRITDLTDPVVKLWKTLEVEDVRIPVKDMAEAVARIS